MPNPLVSLILFAFNQERFVADAVRGALSQTYENLEILISDDNSTDNTARMIEQTIAQFDRENVTFVRQPKNLGLPGHVNSMITEANGEFIVLAAGDDVSVASRVEEIKNAWINSEKKAMLIYSDVEIIDGSGETLGVQKDLFGAANLSLREIVATNCFTHGATCAISKSLFLHFGDLLPQTINEDRAWPLRAKLLGDIVHIDKPLVRYRRFGLNLSDQPGGIWLQRGIQDYQQKIADLESTANFDQGLTNLCRKRIAQLTLRLELTEKKLGNLAFLVECARGSAGLRFGVNHLLRSWFARGYVSAIKKKLKRGPVNR